MADSEAPDPSSGPPPGESPASPSWLVPCACAVLLAMVALRSHFFELFSAVNTKYDGGRFRFVWGQFEGGQVVAATAKLVWNGVLAHLLPLALLLLALWLLCRAWPAAELHVPAWVTYLSILLLLLFTVSEVRFYEGQAATSDEFSQFFQAEVLRHGALSLPHPAPDDFHRVVLVESDRWMSKYPPGWAAFQALFPRSLGYLAPPAISLLALWGLYLLGREIDGVEGARLTVLIAVLCPEFLWNGGAFFPHVCLLAAYALGLALGFVAARKQSLTAALGAGLMLGWGFSIRPVETLLFAIALTIWGLFRLRSWPTSWWLILLGLLGLALGALPALSWLMHTGGFYQGSEPPRGPVHHLVAGFWNAVYPFVRSSVWSAPLYFTLVLGYSYQLLRQERSLRPLAILPLGYWFGSMLAFAAFYDNGQVEYGSRYWLTSWMLLAPLAGAGALRWLRAFPLTKKGFVAAVFACVLFTSATFPASLRQARNLKAGPLQLHLSVEKSSPRGALLFVRSGPTGDVGAIMRNLPGHHLTWLLTLDPVRTRALRQTMASRPAFVVDFDRRQGTFVFTPFEQIDLNSPFSLFHAGISAAVVVENRELAVELWRAIPEGDGFYGSARLNCAQALLRLGRAGEAEAELQRAADAGIPEAELQRVRAQRSTEWERF